MARSINLLVIHCSASPNGDSLTRGTSGKPDFRTADVVIDEWHRQRGFERTHPDSKFWNPKLRSIGYHFVIACNGVTYTGRSLDEPGAHAQGFNANSIGICLTGTDKYTVEQYRLLAIVVAQLTRQFEIPLEAPKRFKSAKHPLGYTVANGVCGHRDLSPDRNGDGLIEPFEYLKTCPGFNVDQWLKGGMKPLQDHLITAVPA